MSEHTPTPWEYKQGEDTRPTWGPKPPKALDPPTGTRKEQMMILLPAGTTDQRIAYVWDWPHNAKANAAFIVRACNAHEDLCHNLWALCDALETLLSSEPEMPTYDNDYVAAEHQLGIARAALAKARAAK